MNVTASQNSCDGNVATSSWGIYGTPFDGSEPLEHEQDQEGDRQAEQPGCFGQRKAEEGEWLYLSLRSRIARDRRDQGREHIADPDAGADQGDTGETGADHLRGSEVHMRFPYFCDGRMWWMKTAVVALQCRCRASRR